MGRICPDHGQLTFSQAFCPNASCGKRAYLDVGTILFSGKYEITCNIAEGGMATIYEAKNTQTGTVVAIKEPRIIPDPADPQKVPNALAKFEAEAVMLEGMSSPHFPAGHDHWDEHNTKFMAMEFISGQDFEQKAMAQGGTMTDEEEILRFGIATSQGLEILHAMNPQIIHRDIKPANVMQDNTGRTIVMDLGIAKNFNPTAGTATSIGTPGYASLEQECGRAEPSSDLYSTAVSMMRLKLGAKVTALDHASRLDEIDNLPASWQGIFRRAIAELPIDRQANVAEFRQDLESLLPAPAPITQPLRPHVRPTPPPAVANPAPRQPDPIRIDFDRTAAGNHGRDHYRQAVAGTVFQGTTQLANAQIVCYIMDYGSGLQYTGQRQNPAVSDRFGRFSLPSRMITVPMTVDRRELFVKVLDPLNPAMIVFEETFTIARPAQQGGIKRLLPWGGASTPTPTSTPLVQHQQALNPATTTPTATKKAAWKTSWKTPAGIGWLVVSASLLLLLYGAAKHYAGPIYFGLYPLAILGPRILIKQEPTDRDKKPGIWKLNWTEVLLPKITLAWFVVGIILFIFKKVN